MDITVWIVAICSLVTLLFATALVFDNRYRDGLVIRAGLTCFAIAAYLRFTSIVIEGERILTPVGAILWVGCALFFSAHYIRFHHFAGLAPKEGERRKQFGAAK